MGQIEVYAALPGDCPDICRPSLVRSGRLSQAPARGLAGRAAGRRSASRASGSASALRWLSQLHLAAGAGIALGIGYAIGALFIIGLVCFGVVKLLGRTPRTRPHERGAVGAGEEHIDPDDGTPHTFDT